MKLPNINLNAMCADLDTDMCTLELIISAFKHKPIEDNILKFSKPVYSVTVQAIEQLREGMTITGKYFAN